MMEPNGAWEDDPLFDEAVRFVIAVQSASVGAIQRHLRIGYSRALRLIGEMERIGILGPADSDGARDVLASSPPEPERPPTKH